ncbi:hypothetical protein JCM12178A_09660 [Salidesulfovibrio brasiliensis]
MPASWHEPFELNARRRRASKPYETTLTFGFRAGESPFGVHFSRVRQRTIAAWPDKQDYRETKRPLKGEAGSETPTQIKPSRKRHPKGERQRRRNTAALSPEA